MHGHCFAAWQRELQPPLEDWITGVEQPDGTWEWTVHLE
jgi:hypothetical protein